MITIPELERHCKSWICVSPWNEVREFYTRENAELALAHGWSVRTAAQYLSDLNKLVKS